MTGTKSDRCQASELAIARLSDAELAAWLESLGPNDAETARLVEAEQARREDQRS